MLIVFKREDKALYRKCLNCMYLEEFRDDHEKYPLTVGVVCSAPQATMVTCFKYDWFRAVGHYYGSQAENIKNVNFNELEEIRKVVDRLKKIGVRK